MPETLSQTRSSLTGRVLRFKFEDGPTAGGTYEHTFAPDGSVSFRKMDGDKEGTGQGKATREKRYASFEVAPEVHLVSYLAEESGYTLTVALNFDTRKLYGFASNDKEWHPVSGTLEVVE
jgi:hypothetical protein